MVYEPLLVVKDADFNKIMKVPCNYIYL